MNYDEVKLEIYGVTTNGDMFFRFKLAQLTLGIDSIPNIDVERVSFYRSCGSEMAYVNLNMLRIIELQAVESSGLVWRLCPVLSQLIHIPIGHWKANRFIL